MAHDGSAVGCVGHAGPPARRPPRVDLVRRSRRGSHVGVRRHLPAVAVDVHLRARLPGRAHGPGARARPGVLLLRRPLHRRRRRGGGARRGRPPRRDPVAAPQEGQEGRLAPQRGRRHAHHRVWSTEPASSSTARAGPAVPAAPCTRPRWAAGERPIDWKPDVCWQLPLRLQEHTDDHGHVTSTLREWKRRDWGEGGHEFHWWCTDSARRLRRRRPRLRHDARRDRRDDRRARLRRCWPAS